MTVSVLPSIAAPPPLQAHTEHWLVVLRAHFELVRAELRSELRSEHPGARHNIDRLLAIATNIDGQIQAVESTRAAVATAWPGGKGPDTPGSAV